jgi:hypothetical protein
LDYTVRNDLTISNFDFEFDFKFKHYRNKINHHIKIGKRKYYHDYFLTYSKDNKKIWNGIKQIIQFKLKTNSRATKIVHNDK